MNAIHARSQLRYWPTRRERLNCNLYGSGNRRGTLVRPGQPLAQLTRSLIRRASIKRHHRGRNPRLPGDVCAPAILRHRRDLDTVDASRNGLFETMNGGGHCIVADQSDIFEVSVQNCTQPGDANKRSN
jgi:hypothetical protein